MDSKRSLFTNLPALETSRLLLRKVSVDDAPDVFRYASDPAVTHFMAWERHKTIDDSLKFLRGVVDAYAAGDARSWAIVRRDDARMIGTAGFLFWDLEARRSEIGYVMAREYWGQGLMTEAVQAILRFGFEVMDLNRIEARCDSLNHGSAKVLAKCGMRHEGTLREQYVLNGEIRDMLLFSILRREWSAG